MKPLRILKGQDILMWTSRAPKSIIFDIAYHIGGADELNGDNQWLNHTKI